MLLWNVVALAAVPEREELILLHWFPDTALNARVLSTAVALYLAESGEPEDGWVEQVEARRLSLLGLTARIDLDHFTRIDGRFGELMLEGEMARLGESAPAAVPRSLADGPAATIEQSPLDAAARLAAVALRPAEIWEALQTRLLARPEAAPIPEAWWSPLLTRHAQAVAADLDPVGQAFARKIADALLESATEETDESLVALDILLAEVQRFWFARAYLAAVWRLLEAAWQVQDMEPQAAGRVATAIAALEPWPPA